MKTNGFYVGYTADIGKRLLYHNSGLSRYTRDKGPWKVRYQESYSSKKEALLREKFLKQQRNTQFYERLIHGT
jgi:putative endonuclease